MHHHHLFVAFAFLHQNKLPYQSKRDQFANYYLLILDISKQTQGKLATNVMNLDKMDMHH